MFGRGNGPGILALFCAGIIGHGATTIRACDVCGCYTPQVEAASQTDPFAKFWTKGWFAAAAQQFTNFGTLQRDGVEIANPVGQYENSSITQLLGGYNLNDRFGFQLNLPVIYREFKRPEGFGIDRGTESGMGDMSLLFKGVLFHHTSGGGRSFEFQGKNPVAVEHEPEFAASAVVLTGVKFPTGNTSRLEEEFHETQVPGAPPSGIHGHDLTLGTGSWDGIFGEQNSIRYRGFFFETNVQFTLRGDGAHQYHFANDLIWNGGPGYYLIRDSQGIVGVQCVISGEHKDVDRFRGKPAEDTGVTSVFAGPRLVGSRGRWSAEVDVDIPISIDNTSIQIVPDYRLRGGVSVHF